MRVQSFKTLHISYPLLDGFEQRIYNQKNSSLDVVVKKISQAGWKVRVDIMCASPHYHISTILWKVADYRTTGRLLFFLLYIL
jgi:hypothetical protein